MRTIQQWTNQQGGEVIDARAQRLAAIGNELQARVECSPLHFHVLRNSALAAYSWASGDIYLTSSLMDAATDDEIAASVAHELGHLLNNGDAHTVLSLRGVTAPASVEERADRVGCHLLAASGRSPAALLDVLQKICAAAPSAECRAEISQRIQAIHDEFPSP